MLLDLDFPGYVAEARLDGRNRVVFFSNVSWPSVFPLNRFDPQLDLELQYGALWWERHLVLTQPSARTQALLALLDPHGYYTPYEVLAAFVKCGFRDEESDPDQVSERIQLMPRLNGWMTPAVTGALWRAGRHQISSAPAGMVPPRDSAPSFAQNGRGSSPSPTSAIPAVAFSWHQQHAMTLNESHSNT